MVSLLVTLVISVVCVDKDVQTLIEYFLVNRTDTGLVQDRASDRTLVSCAATGFGFVALAIAEREGLEDRRYVLDQCKRGFVETTSRARSGWLYHFTDTAGNPRFNCEVSTIYTALFYAGAFEASRRLSDGDFTELVAREFSKISVETVLCDGYFHHGFYEEPRRLIPWVWDEYSEGILLYRLFRKDFILRNTKFDLPLFVYYYPLCFYDEPLMRENFNRAIDWQFERYGVCGVTACDGPRGYCVNDPNVVSPLSVWAASKFNKKGAGLLEQIEKSHPRTLGSFSRDGKWRSTDSIGIDIGATLLILERYSSKDE